MSKEFNFDFEKSTLVENIIIASQNLRGISSHTPLMHNINISDEHKANVYLKREDLQVVRSYKIRGAYNKISSLSKEQLEKGVVCASAGNHAQGVAYSCNKLGINGKIYMPSPTPNQKIKQVKMFGKNNIEIILTGDTYDDCFNTAIDYCKKNDKTFIAPFDDIKVIEGQGTVGLEILNDADFKIDYLFVPIGGGGLASGVSTYFRKFSPNTKIIGVEPMGAPAMKKSIEQGKVITLDKIDKFVDGAAVQRVGDLTFEICKKNIDEVALVPEGKICSTILKLYNQDAIVVEPAGALTLSVLDYYQEEIKGKNIVCILSGSNNDITRTEDIKERSLMYEKLKHYFIIRFPQRAGALMEFLSKVLGPNDDIAYFEYKKKNSRETGPALIGIELQDKDDFEPLIQRMKDHEIIYEYLNDNPDLFQYLI